MRKLLLIGLFVIVLLACGGTPTIESTSTPEPTSTPVITGKWQSDIEPSSFDDSTNVYLLLDAENRIQGWLDTFLPTLVVRCKEHEVNVYINVGTQTAVEYNSDLSTARIRFDQDEAQTISMSGSTDGDSLFFPDPNQALQQILSHEILLFGFTPFNANPVETKFDLRGVNEVIKPLKEACP